MKRCQQTQGQSVLAHGYSVKNYIFDLMGHLESGSPLKYEWKIPEWVYPNKKSILSSLPPKETLKLAAVMHDCGKPFCRTVDAEGRQHFPGHAEMSYDVFNSFYEDSVAAHLILHDMDIHTLKSDGVEGFMRNPYHLTHLLIGLAELHSNAAMFGGTDSVSFKIKWKAINSRGNQIFKLLNNNKQYEKSTTNQAVNV